MVGSRRAAVDRCARFHSSGGRLSTSTLAVAVVAAASLARQARADNLLANSDVCVMAVHQTPGTTLLHAAVTGLDASSQSHLYIAWNAGSWAWWTPPLPPVQTTQLACGAVSDQGIIAYRDADSNVKAIDRRSNWQVADLGKRSADSGMWGTMVVDQGVLRFPLFVPGEDGHLWLIVWSESPGPGWAPPVDLGLVPDSESPTAYLSGYWEPVGPDSAHWRALVSVFVVSNFGTLIENKGYLDGSPRTYIDHGLAPGNRVVLSSAAWRPAAVAWLTAPVDNHPEDVFNKRVVVTAMSPSTTYTYQRVQTGLGPWSWQGLRAASDLNLTGAVASCGPGFCPAARTIGFSSGQFWKNDASLGTLWTALPGAASMQMLPFLFFNTMYYVQSPSNLAVLDTDALTITNVGHP
jgi:hypothetical protein